MPWLCNVAEGLDIDMNERKDRLIEVAKQPGELFLEMTFGLKRAKV